MACYYRFPTIVALVIFLSDYSAAYKQRIYQEKYAVEKECTEIYNETTRHTVPYIETYTVRNWLGAKKQQLRLNYRYEDRVTHHYRKVCCKGYTSYNSSLCIPSCGNGCGQFGVCSIPDHCHCNIGYHFNEDRFNCEPVCEVDCVHGTCTEPNKCTCDSGYYMSDDNFTCKPLCLDCHNLEYCLEPHKCRCLNGYERTPMDRSDLLPYAPCRPVCEMPCINSSCSEPNVCRCWDGYADFDNDSFACEPKCNAEQQQKFNGSQGCFMGECVAPGQCSCIQGYRISKTEKFVCEPICDKKCVHGKCSFPNVCACDEGYYQTDEEGAENICHPICTKGCPHGKCVGPDICSCDPGYEWDTETNKTLSTCKPVCRDGCIFGECVAPDQCECLAGYAKNDSRNVCEPVCSQVCVNGRCAKPGYCECNDGYVKKNSSEPGDAYVCAVACECENGYCNDVNSTCERCKDGYELILYENSTVCRPRCEGGCVNGDCVGPQECYCNEDYVARNDSQGNPICVHACGGTCLHGVCLSEESTCNCFYGWTGRFCDDSYLCAILVTINDNQTMADGLVDYDWDNSTATLEAPWKGPICDDNCLMFLKDVKCSNQTSDYGESQKICFLNNNSQCNVVKEVQSFSKVAKYEARVSMTTITISTMSTILVIAALTALIVFTKKRRANLMTSMAILKRNYRQEEDSIGDDDDDDGISL